MEIVLQCLLRVLPACLAAALAAVYFVHMLQLCSYQWGQYRHYIQKNAKTIFGLRRMVALLLVLPFVLQHRGADSGWYYALLLLAYSGLNRPHKAKKPLVYTARVKRMLCTAGILFLLALLPGLFLPYGMAAFGLALYLAPFVLALSNWLNSPMEKAIANRYVRQAREKLAAMPALTVIGITGSFGKTSTKYFLNTLLSTQYHVLMTPGNYNTTLGVVRTVREMLSPTHQIFLCEMGARHKGDIKEICDLVHPRYGVITAIGEQHLESFGSVDTIIQTKFELYDAVPDQGLVFLNFDNEAIASHGIRPNVIRYGLEGERDYKATDIVVTGQGTEFTVTGPDGQSTRFRTRLLGEHNVQNITAAIAVSHQLGIPFEKLVPAVRRLEAVPHRMQLIRGGGNYTVIDDAYNSNPKGAEAALRTLDLCQGLRILVTPGMVELGEKEYELNYAFGQFAASRCDYVALVNPKQSEPIRKGLLDAGFPEEKLYVAQTLQQAIQFAQTCGQPNEPRFVLLENDLPDNYG